MPARGRRGGQDPSGPARAGTRVDRAGAQEDRQEDRQEDPREDVDLLRAHVAGDPWAFEEIVRRHSPRLWALAAGVLRDGDEAADALQDAFVSALRGAASFRGDAAVGTWLHRIVVNACLDRLRRSRARPTVPLDAPFAGEGPGAADRLRAPGDRHAQVEVEVVVRAALGELPAHQRAALVLVDLHDMPVAEAAAVLGVAVGTVKSRCARGRTALAGLLRARGLDPRGAGACGTDGGAGGADAAVPQGNRTGPHDVRGGEGSRAGRRGRVRAGPPPAGPPPPVLPPGSPPPPTGAPARPGTPRTRPTDPEEVP